MPNKNRLTEGQIRDFKSGRETVKGPSGLGAHARELLRRMAEEKARKNAPNISKKEMDRWNKMHQQNVKQEMSRAKKNAPKI